MAGLIIHIPVQMFLISKGASKDGSVMISYNADAGGFMEPLYFMEARDWVQRFP